MAVPPHRAKGTGRPRVKGRIITARLALAPNIRPKKRAIALTIAGSDSSGGAGIQADIRTFSVHGVHGASVITALTAQNTLGVDAIVNVDPVFIGGQFDAVTSDLRIDAAKTGMLGTAAAVREVLAALERHPIPNLVVDPVMVSTSGATLLEPDAIALIRDELLPLAMVLTPNLAEAARLLGREEAGSEDAMVEQGIALTMLGARWVVLKGGHSKGPNAMDVVVCGDGYDFLDAERIETNQTHGTGCVLSAAITAMLALDAEPGYAIRHAKDFVQTGIVYAKGSPIGHGHGPVDALHTVKKPATSFDRD